MRKALYRKYRPISLDDVVGQDTTVKVLQESIKHSAFSHAYIFTGPRGCGKTSVARIFAHEVNSFQYELEDNYIDIIEIDAASNTSVENIRDLREKAIIAPSEGKYKIYIIDEFHMLSKSAFNALLKIMEEPPKHVIFILATTNLEKVPITITSRAQILTFKLATPDVMLAFLQKITTLEKINIDETALKIIAERGGGSFRDTLSILDQISTLKTSSDLISADDVNTALGLPDEQLLKQVLDSFNHEDITTTINLLKDLLNSGVSASNISGELIKLIIENPTQKTLVLINKLFSVDYPFAEAKLLVAFLDSADVVKNTTITSPAISPKQPSEITPATPINLQPKTPIATSSSRREELLKRINRSKILEKTRHEEIKNEEPPVAMSLTESVIKAGELDLKSYLDDVKNTNSMLGATLEKSDFVIKDQELTIYPINKNYVSILKARNNITILKKSAPGYNICILDPTENIIPKNAVHFYQTEEESPANPELEKTINSLSDIMGSGIKNINLDNPF